MKNIYILLLLGTTLSNAQITFEEHIIQNTQLQPNVILSIDMDYDGDIDLFTASNGSNQVTFFENTGPGNFIIESNIGSGNDFGVGDWNADGIIDLIVSTPGGGSLDLYVNDGQGNLNFNWNLEFANGYSGYTDIKIADLDSGNGFNEIVHTGNDGPHIIWGDVNSYYNGAAPLSSGPSASLEMFDINNDGFVDIVATASPDEIAWFENNQTWVTHTISTEVDGASDVFLSDLDGDGDKDVISASFNDHKIAWYENTDGNGTFGPQNIISSDAVGATSVYAADLDNDGDMDVVSSSEFDNKIAWYENDGTGEFILHIISTTAEDASCVTVADLDNDGDLDIAYTSPGNDNIAWFENLGITLDSSENRELVFNVSPVPANKIIHIQAASEITEIIICNTLGQEVQKATNTNYIDISALSSGTYILSVKDINGFAGNKSIIKN